MNECEERRRYNKYCEGKKLKGERDVWEGNSNSNEGKELSVALISLNWWRDQRSQATND